MTALEIAVALLALAQIVLSAVVLYLRKDLLFFMRASGKIFYNQTNVFSVMAKKLDDIVENQHLLQQDFKNKVAPWLEIEDEEDYFLVGGEINEAYIPDLEDTVVEGFARGLNKKGKVSYD